MATAQAATLAKGLRLLSALLDDEGRSPLSVIAATMDLPLPTAHRLALTLEAEGYIVRGSKGYYHPGPTLFGGSAPESAPARAAARLRRPLARLAVAYRAFAHFGVLEDGMVTYLVKEKGAEHDLFTAEQMQLEAYCSAIGKVLLAALPPADLNAYLATGPFVALTEHTLTDPEAIRSTLSEVRHRDIGFDRHEIRDDLFCLAVPVRDQMGETIGAISLSLVDQSPDPTQIARVRRQLRSIATRVTGRL